VLTAKLFDIQGKLTESYCARAFVDRQDCATAIGRDGVKAEIDQAGRLRTEWKRKPIANAMRLCYALFITHGTGFPFVRPVLAGLFYSPALSRATNFSASGVSFDPLFKCSPRHPYAFPSADRGQFARRQQLVGFRAAEIQNPPNLFRLEQYCDRHYVRDSHSVSSLLHPAVLRPDASLM
jgi:hypothetical protein